MILWILVAIVLISGIIGGLHRGLENRPNWGSLQRESTYVWENHESVRGTSMFGYLPTATFLLWPFMVWPPQPLGLYLYLASNILAGLASLWIVYRYWRPPGKTFGPLFAVPAFLICANFQHVTQANQLTLWTLVLCVGGLALVGHKHSFLGGIVIGLAGLLKVMPFFLFGFLLLKRKWMSLAGLAVAILVFDLLPCLAFFGWDGTVKEHQAWLRRAEMHANSRQIEDPLLIGVYRHTSNFSYAGVLTRWLRGMPEAEKMLVLVGDCPPEIVADRRANLEPDEVLVEAPFPPQDKPWTEVRRSIDHIPRFHIAEFSAETVWWIWIGSLTLGLAALVLFTCLYHWVHGDRDWPVGAALWMLAIFFLSPMTRHYYLALAFPAVAIVWHSFWTKQNNWLSAAALVAWFIGVLCLGWNLGRWYGLHLAVLAILIAATAGSWPTFVPDREPKTTGP